MSRYLSLKFWFMSSSITLKTALVLAIFYVLMIASAVAMKLWLRAKKKEVDHLFKSLINKVCTLLFYMGFIGLVIAFFMYEGAYFVSYKFWFLAWLGVTIYWTYKIAKYALSIPEKKREIEKKQNYDKYLPKKKQ